MLTWEPFAQYGALGLISFGLLVFSGQSYRALSRRLRELDDRTWKVLVGLVTECTSELRLMRAAIEAAPCRAGLEPFAAAKTAGSQTKSENML